MSTTKKQSAQYKVIIERDEDGFFVASVPTLPGCQTQAKTYPELLKNIKEAIQLCLEVANEDPSYRRQIRERAGKEPGFVGVDLVTV